MGPTQGRSHPTILLRYFFLLCSVADELAVEVPLVPLQPLEGNEVTSLEEADSFWFAKYQLCSPPLRLIAVTKGTNKVRRWCCAGIAAADGNIRTGSI